MGFGLGICGKCCGANCSRLCVTVRGCNNLPVPGSTVTAVQGGSTVATGTADGQITGITLTNAGTGYVLGTIPTVTISGGSPTTPATAIAIMTAAGTAISTLFMTSFGSGYQGTPTVAISAPPSGTTATGTAVYVSRVCLGYVNTGSTTINVSPPGANYNTGSTTVTLDCTSTTQTITITAATGYHCCSGTASGNPFGCGPYPGTLYITDSNGTWPLTFGGNVLRSVAWWASTPNIAKSSTLHATGPCTAGTVPYRYDLSCGLGQADGTHLFTVRLLWSIPGNCPDVTCPDFVDQSVDNTVGLTNTNLLEVRFQLDLPPCPPLGSLVLTGTIPSTIPANPIGNPCTTPPANWLVPAPGSFTLTE